MSRVVGVAEYISGATSSPKTARTDPLLFADRIYGVPREMRAPCAEGSGLAAIRKYLTRDKEKEPYLSKDPSP